MVKTLQQTVEDFADNRLLQKSFLWTGGLKKELSKIFWIYPCPLSVEVSRLQQESSTYICIGNM